MRLISDAELAFRRVCGEPHSSPCDIEWSHLSHSSCRSLALPLQLTCNEEKPKNHNLLEVILIV
jgi:hypothetical protein